MKKFRILSMLAGLILVLPFAYAQTAQDDPAADPAAVVTVGNARFTVLTPQLIRMEWAEDGLFEDRATFGVVNRKLPVPAYKVRRSGKGVTISTGGLPLVYKGPGKFDGKTLRADFRLNGKKVTWTPDSTPEGNLLGTTRTLDGCDGEQVADPFDLGVVSRDGWAVLDESGRHLFVPVESDWKQWVAEPRDGDRQDLYLFAYGHDYKGAVRDFTKIAGRIPLPPKYAFGYWWCRYWQYSDYELVDLARHFKDLDIPADVMIIDMDWHETWAPDEYPGLKDESGEGLGWTGYTWKKEFFPNPENLLTTLHNFGLKTSLNIHPASGIQVYEEPYERFVKDYLSRTSDYDGPKNYRKEDGTPAYVPFRMDQIAWADAYMNSVMHPFEKQGVDFWWLDWQQYRQSRYVKGLSNTFWLNYTFFQDMVRQSEGEGLKARRPMIYHRWGGIGSHRYQVGFSGDTYATWKVLGYLPWFTATAANVGYGYWGHDIGGHQQPRGVNETDPELYTRWLQGGVFTPIFKTHSTKNMSMEKRFWVFPDHFDAMRAAIRLRYTLSPYIYTAAREAYDTGISLCRPLYYDYPEADEAYTWKEEFLFGNDILATVVAAPADKVTGLAAREMWFPEEDDWFDVATGALYRGGTTAGLSYTIDENPWFVKAASVIPLAPEDIHSLQEVSNVARLLVAPGDGTSSTVLYEDDGATQAYSANYCTTKISLQAEPGRKTLVVAPREGSYDGAPATRHIRVEFASVLPPTSVRVNGKVVPYDRFAGDGQWTYDGSELTAVVYLPASPAGEALTVVCEWDGGNASPAYIYGKKGLIRRMMALSPEMKYEYATYVHGGVQIPKPFLHISGCGSALTENPEQAAQLLGGLDTDALNGHLDAVPQIPDGFRRKVAAQCRIQTDGQ